MGVRAWWRRFSRQQRALDEAQRIATEANRRERAMRFGQVEPITPDPTHGRPRTGVTTDRTDPRLAHGDDTEPVEQAPVYLVLSDEERAKGFVRPVRSTYLHEVCGSTTSMGLAIAETYARDPSFYKGTFCAKCSKHRPVGADGEFIWLDGSKVGT